MSFLKLKLHSLPRAGGITCASNFSYLSIINKWTAGSNYAHGISFNAACILQLNLCTLHTTQSLFKKLKLSTLDIQIKDSRVSRFHFNFKFSIDGETQSVITQRNNKESPIFVQYPVFYLIKKKNEKKIQY